MKRKTFKQRLEEERANVDPREWTTLLIHEGSENTPDIETVCTENDIPVRYSRVNLEKFGSFEKVEIFTTPENYEKLIVVLKEKGLCSDRGYWLGK